MTGPRLPRDEVGWRVPTEQTLSWHVYRLTKMGWGPSKIARAAGVSYNTVAVLLWKIKHPERANVQSRLGST